MSIRNEFTPPTIIDYDYYVSQYVLPVTDNTAGQKELIDRWIIQCQDQIDVLCGGRVYDEYSELDLTKEKDQKRAYYLRKAICSLLEYYIDTGKAFVDKNFSSASNVPANINASSEDANFEHKRKDIIKLLTQGGWYQTFNSYTSALDFNYCGALTYDFDFSELVERLNEIFKRIDNKNTFNADQVLSQHNLTHIGNLVGYNANTSYLRNFVLDSSVDLSKVVSVSKEGSSSVKVNFITINGKEYFLGGGGGGGSLVTAIRQNGIDVLDYDTGIAEIDAYKKEDAQTKVYYGETEPENPKDNDIWVYNSTSTSAINYDLLTNKPKINNVELVGNKSLSEIGTYGVYDAEHTDTTTYNAQTIDQKVSENAAIFRGTFTGGTTRPASFDYDNYCKNQMTAEGITPTNADYLFIYWSDMQEYDRCRYTQATNTWQFEYTYKEFQQVQSNWAQTNETQVDFIKNKPHLYKHVLVVELQGEGTNGYVRYELQNNVGTQYTTSTLPDMWNTTATMSLGSTPTMDNYPCIIYKYATAIAGVALINNAWSTLNSIILSVSDTVTQIF